MEPPFELIRREVDSVRPAATFGTVRPWCRRPVGTEKFSTRLNWIGWVDALLCSVVWYVNFCRQLNALDWKHQRCSPLKRNSCLYVYINNQFSEQKTLRVIKAACRWCFFLTVSCADEAVKATAFERLYRDKHGGASSLSALLPYVFAALSNTFQSCLFFFPLCLRL